MPTKRIKRYSPELHTFAFSDPVVKMGESPQGMYVLHADYAKLEELVLAFMASCKHDWKHTEGPFGTMVCNKCGSYK